MRKIGAADIFAFLGIISILSLFVVLPYAIGYFSYFGPRTMALFSLNDLYQFSAYPILSITLLIVLFIGLEQLIDKVWPSFPLPVWRRLRSRLLAVVILAPLLFVFNPVYLVVTIILATLGPFLIVYVLRGKRERSAMMVLSFGWMLVMLFTWGVATAHRASTAPNTVTVSIVGKQIVGNPAFVGNNSIMILGSQRELMVVRLDNGNTATFDRVQDRAWMNCVAIFESVRTFLGMGCILSRS